MEIMKIKVTQKHIDKGRTGACRDCPIALAIRDVVDGQVTVTCAHVYLNALHVYKNDRVLNLPRSAVLFIRHFDRSRGLAKPFSFELEI